MRHICNKRLIETTNLVEPKYHLGNLHTLGALAALGELAQKNHHHGHINALEKVAGQNGNLGS